MGLSVSRFEVYTRGGGRVWACRETAGGVEGVSCRFGGSSFDVSVERGKTSSTQRSKRMRVLVIVKASPESEAGQMPTESLLAEMGKYNEQLVNAGVMRHLTRRA